MARANAVEERVISRKWDRKWRTRPYFWAIVISNPESGHDFSCLQRLRTSWKDRGFLLELIKEEICHLKHIAFSSVSWHKKLSWKFFLWSWDVTLINKVCPLSPVFTASNKQTNKCQTASTSNNSSNQQPPQIASAKMFAETTTQSTPYIKSRWYFLLKTDLFPIYLPTGEKMLKIFSNPIHKIL